MLPPAPARLVTSLGCLAVHALVPQFSSPEAARGSWAERIHSQGPQRVVSRMPSPELVAWRMEALASLCSQWDQCTDAVHNPLPRPSILYSVCGGKTSPCSRIVCQVMACTKKSRLCEQDSEAQNEAETRTVMPGALELKGGRLPTGVQLLAE